MQFELQGAVLTQAESSEGLVSTEEFMPTRGAERLGLMSRSRW
jgi:hypothetical protein